MTKEEFLDENGLTSTLHCIGGIDWRIINTPEGEAKIRRQMDAALKGFRECQAKAKAVYTEDDRNWKPASDWKPRWEREREAVA